MSRKRHGFREIKGFLSILFVVVIPFTIVSCALRPKPTVLLEPPPALLGQLEEGLKGVKSYGISGRFTLNDRDLGLFGQLFILAKSPGSLRIEVSSVFGNTILALTLKEGIIRALEPASYTYYQGKASPENLKRLLRLPPLTPSDLYGLFIGRLDPSKGRIKQDETGRLLLDSHIFLEVAGGLLNGMEKKGQGGFALKLSGFEESQGVRFPQTISLFWNNGGSLKLSYSEVILNPEVEGGAFELFPPAGFKIVSLD